MLPRPIRDKEFLERVAAGAKQVVDRYEANPETSPWNNVVYVATRTLGIVNGTDEIKWNYKNPHDTVPTTDVSMILPGDTITEEQFDRLFEFVDGRRYSIHKAKYDFYPIAAMSAPMVIKKGDAYIDTLGTPLVVVAAGKKNVRYHSLSHSGNGWDSNACATQDFNVITGSASFMHRLGINEALALLEHGQDPMADYSDNAHRRASLVTTTMLGRPLASGRYLVIGRFYGAVLKRLRAAGIKSPTDLLNKFQLAESVRGDLEYHWGLFGGEITASRTNFMSELCHANTPPTKDVYYQRLNSLLDIGKAIDQAFYERLFDSHVLRQAIVSALLVLRHEDKGSEPLSEEEQKLFDLLGYVDYRLLRRAPVGNSGVVTALLRIKRADSARFLMAGLLDSAESEKAAKEAQRASDVRRALKSIYDNTESTQSADNILNKLQEVIKNNAQ